MVIEKFFSRSVSKKKYLTYGLKLSDSPKNIHFGGEKGLRVILSNLSFKLDKKVLRHDIVKKLDHTSACIDHLVAS